MRTTVVTTVTSGAGGVLLLALLVSCGDAGGGDGERPSISPTRTPTAEVPSTSEPTADVPTTEPTTVAPSPELPSPTRTPERTERPDELESPLTSEPDPSEPDPSEPEPEPEPTAPESTVRESSVPPLTEPEPTEPEPAPQTVTPSAEAQEPEPEPAEDEGVATWIWGLAAALVLGCLAAIPLVMRARRRNGWSRDLSHAEGEVAWLARELLPELRRADSRQGMAGGWAVSQARVSAAEDRLTVLESSAPDDRGRARARELRDAARAARADMQPLLGPRPHDTWTMDLDAIINDLETALRRPPVTSPE